MKLLNHFVLGVALATTGSLSLAETYTVQLNGGVTLSVTQENFDPHAHKLEGCAPYKNCFVDGVIRIGLNRPPSTAVTRIILITGDKKYRLDTSGMYDAHLSAKNTHPDFGGYCYDPDNCTVRGALGDAGGVFAVEWVITNGFARRTVLSDSEDLFQFFQANLVAPKYE